MSLNSHILQPEVQAFIRQDASRDPAKIALANSPFKDVSASELAEQIDARQRCKNKLPLWYLAPNIYYPKRISIEQSSSEEAASYKASILKDTKNMADLTGGMGVDTYFFSKGKEFVQHCEILPTLSRIAQHNAQALQAPNIHFHAGDGLTWLRGQSSNTWEALYLDPARRIDNRRLYRLEDTFPNVIDYLDLLFEKSPLILVKAAPMVDIQESEKSLQGKVKEIHILSIQQECKEVLFLLDRNHQGPPKRIATMLTKGGITAQSLTFSIEEERHVNVEYASIPDKFLFEPDVSLLKAGAFKTIAKHFKIKKFHPHTHLYTSADPIPNFMGKTIEVLESIPYSIFKKTKKIEEGAIVVSKNFPLKAEELRKKHKIKEHRHIHLYFLTDLAGQLIVVKGRITS